MDFKKLGNALWEMPKEATMRVPARIFATEKLFKEIEQGAMQQLVNTAALPGIQTAALGMPDMHWGYGFPIGGVAAFDAKEGGVVSPGGIGFDINCLKAGTAVLHKFGFSRKIEEFEQCFEKEKIACLADGEIGRKFGNSSIGVFMKKNETGNILRISTESGQEIFATKDHPFFTKNGMVKAGELGLDEVAIYPFKGVPFQQQTEIIIVDEKEIETNYVGNKNGLKQAMAFLKVRGLLPLRENNEKLPLLAKICGFVQGDGTLHFLKSSGAVGGFYGKLEDLKEIKQDLKELGFGSHLYSRKRHHKIKTTYGTSDFWFEENSLMIGSAALIALLVALGCTTGNKTKKEFFVPKWVLDAPLWIKRLYIAALFGAELSSPKTVSRHGFNFYGPVLSMNKKKQLSENCRHYLTQIRDLLKEFGVKSELIAERLEFVNLKGEVSIRHRLQIGAEPSNLQRLWSTVGFEYNNKKRNLANSAVLYLRMKKKILNARQESIALAKELHQQNKTVNQIVAIIGSPFVNKRFVQRSLWEERKTDARIAMNFEKFSDFKDKKAMGLEETGFLWDKIEKIEEIPFNGEVYDFTVNDQNHNFIANGFLVSNCGVRLIRTNLSAEEIKPKVRELIDVLFDLVPAGVGGKGKIKLNETQLRELLQHGARWAVENGYGWEKDLKHIEENGEMKGANSEKVSQKALQRGMPQSGTLGSGNHFLEIQRVEQVFDEKIAKKFGLFQGQAVVMLHSGSRGCGHQIATDYIDVMLNAMQKYGISVPDRQLACAPIESKEGQDYLQAMNCGVNYAFANRQAMMHWTREGFAQILGQDAEKLGMELVYDICHNVAKFEQHEIDGKRKEVLIHRKGATRAMPAGRKENPADYMDTGHPAIIPGSMGTASYVIVGTKKGLEEAFASVCHGAGRVMSRTAAMKAKRGEQVKRELEAKGEIVKGASWAGLAEEAPEAYKDIDEVIKSIELAGIGLKVAKMVPLGVMKG